MKLPWQRKPQDEGIAIIGLAGRFPKSPTIEAYWENLCQGRELISFFTDEELANAGVSPDLLRNPDYIKASPVLEDYDKFDAEFFKFSSRVAMAMDPQQRVLLECAWETFERAGYAVGDTPKNVGVFTGSGSSVSSYLLEFVKSFPEIQGDTGILDHLGNDKDFVSTRISYKLNLTGPSINVQTACSTSLVAVHLACQSLLNGECEMALAGAISVRIPQIAGYMRHKGGIHSQDGHCCTFDANSTGVLFGSGGGLVLLKPLKNALQDGDTIYAVIKGTAINNDGGNKVGYSASSAIGEEACMVEAFKKAKLSPETVHYVETHGTGTVMGDPIEITALTQAFRKFTDKKQFCVVGSVKANIGHLDSAAGIAGLIKTVLVLYNGKIPPSINITTLNPKINFKDSPFYVCTQLEPWGKMNTPRRAAVNALGMGGTNAFVVLESPPHVEKPSTGATKPYYLIGISAINEKALDRKIVDLQAWLDKQDAIALADVAYTLNAARSHFNHRYAVIVTSLDEFKAALQKIKNRVSAENILKSLNSDEMPIKPDHDETYKRLISEIKKYKRLSATEYRDKLYTMGNLYISGYNPDWNALHEGETRHKLLMPTYPFAREHYLISR